MSTPNDPPFTSRFGSLSLADGESAQRSMLDYPANTTTIITTAPESYPFAPQPPTLPIDRFASLQISDHQIPSIQIDDVDMHSAHPADSSFWQQQQQQQQVTQTQTSPCSSTIDVDMDKCDDRYRQSLDNDAFADLNRLYTSHTTASVPASPSPPSSSSPSASSSSFPLPSPSVLSPSLTACAPEREEALAKLSAKSSRSEAAAAGSMNMRLMQFSTVRLLPTIPSSFLRTGSTFVGTQKSRNKLYSVKVEIKYVDMAQSYICGSLCIDGLTPEYPCFTTFFDGEIVGDKYSFYTTHPSWNTSPAVDLDHWGRFPSLRALRHCRYRDSQSKHQQQQSRDRGEDFELLLQDAPEIPSYEALLSRNRIYMRWKEHSLATEPGVRAVREANFGGFYYISFNMVTGNINGLYYALRSERYQELELRPVHNGGCSPALEMR